MRKLAHIEKIEWIKPIEGRDRIVFRSKDGTHSFKAVSPEFLIKHNE